MKKEVSQLEYLSHRKKSYNIKYSMFLELIKNFRKRTNVLELFAGVGIASGLIHDILNPKYHKVYEINPDCYNSLLKKQMKIPLIAVNETAFNEDNYTLFDYIIIDPNSFTIKNYLDYKKIFKKISEQNKNSELIVTETGIFNTRFTGKTPKQHYEELNKELNKLGFYIKTALYKNNFGMLHLVQKPIELKIQYWDKEDENWKKYI